MQIWLGTSKGISRRSWRYATRSTNGMTKFNPGASTAWKRPRRSTTSACCCGTTRIAWMTTITATMNSASVTIDDPIIVADSMLEALGSDLRLAGPAIGENEHRAARANDVHGLGLRCRRGCKLGIPCAAPVCDARRAARAPALNADHLSDIEIGLGGCSGAQAAFPPLQQHHAGNAKHACGQPLQRRSRPAQRSDPGTG